MENHDTEIMDYGFAKKKLSIYFFGYIACIFLTIGSFWVATQNKLDVFTILLLLYLSAIIQFVVQTVCFLRMNVKTTQARINAYSFLFVIVVITTIVAGTLWIMYNLNYRMM